MGAVINITSVKDFGAVGDGQTDDTSAIQLALDSGAARVIVPEGVYLVSNCVRPASHQTVELLGTLKLAPANIQLLTSDVVPGDNRLRVADATGFYPGQWVSVGDKHLPRQRGGTQTRGECAECGRIVEIRKDILVIDGVFRRGYTMAADARAGTQPSVILIENQTHVRICGAGVIDGNKGAQYDVAPLRFGGSEETRAGCGIAGDADAVGGLAAVAIDGVTVQNAILHNICLRRVSDSVVRNTTCTGAHDKNIILFEAQDCQIVNNRALRSDFEDGIILHQKTGCKRILIQGNICAENSRNGIHVGAGENAVQLRHNLCVNNRTNIFLAGDNCSSTGDVSLHTDGVPKSRGLVLYGRGNQVNGVTVLGSPNINITAGAVDSHIHGGVAGGVDASPAGVGLSVTGQQSYTSAHGAAQLSVRDMLFWRCRVALRAEAGVGAVTLKENRFCQNARDMELAPEARAQVSLD